MSKRTGNAITLRDIMDEVGVDAARYFLTMRSLILISILIWNLRKESQDNPVYYAQYAHENIIYYSPSRRKGIKLDKDVDLSLITHDKAELLRKLLNLNQRLYQLQNHVVHIV